MEEGQGQRYGQYQTLRELGRGGMGVVYKAHDEALGRMVALKVLPDRLAANKSFIDRFQREARAVAAINHPNIVTIFNIGSDGGHHFIAMEFVKGRPLNEVINERGQLGVEEALRIAKQVASALGAAHRVGIIHRDVKPHNVMIDASGRAKVMDFGIAKVGQDQATALTKTGDILGTPAYIAPEQCKGKEIDGRADLYSLGVALYQMLAGTLPFGGETPLELIQKILFEPPPPIQDFNPSVPRGVGAVIERLLAKEPDGRYADAEELEQDIDSLLANGELLSAQPGRPKRIPAARRKADEPPPLTPALARFGTQPAASDSGYYTPLPARVGRGVGLAIGGLLLMGLAIGGGALGMRYIQGRTPGAPPGSDPARAATPTPQATLAAAETPLPPPADPASLPRLQWVDAPEEGSRVRAAEVQVSWHVANSMILRGFRVGVNNPDPAIESAETNKTIKLVKPGPQTLTVIPMTPSGARGEPLTRTFLYEPNRPPTLDSATISNEIIREGESASIAGTASDPDGDPTHLEGRVSEGEWMPLDRLAGHTAELAAGHYKLEARAADADGGFSEPRVWTLEVKPLNETAAPPPETPTPPPTPVPTPVQLVFKPTPTPSAAIMALTKLDQRNYQKAKDLYRGRFASPAPQDAAQAAADAAAIESPLAKMLAALVYSGGRGGAKSDPARATELSRLAMQELPKIANGGDAEAQYLMGQAASRGVGIAQDNDLALMWTQRAADAGHPDAIAALGAFHDRGVGVAKSPIEAAKLYRRGAEYGDPAALHNLAVSHERGEGVEKDEAKAYELYQKAAESGHAPAMHNLALCYEEGRGVDRSPTRAAEWYRKAAERGESESMNNLAQLLLESDGGATLDAEAAGWLEKAAATGNSAAMANLGFVYDAGRGVAPDPAKAAEWHRKAAEAGNARGMFNLGASYELGEGLPADPVQADIWYARAAEAGHVEAMANHARMLELGRGIPADRAAAIEWYKKAAALGSAQAQASLARLGQ